MITTDTGNLKVLSGDVLIERVGAMDVEMFETFYGVNKYRITVSDRVSTIWDSIASSTNVIGKLRVGAGHGASGSTLWSTWRTFRIVKIVIHTLGDVMEVTVLGVDLLFDLRHQAPQRTFNKMLISDMMSSILGDYKELGVDIESSTDQYTLRQGTASDYDFFTNDLLARYRKEDPQELFFHYITHESGKPVLTLTSLNKIATKGLSSVINFTYDSKPNQADPLARAYLKEFWSVMRVTPLNFGMKYVTFDSLKSQIEPYLLERIRSDDSTTYPTFGARKPATFHPTDSDVFGEIRPLVMDALDLDFTKELNNRADWQLVGSHRVVVPTGLLPKLSIGSLGQIDAVTTKGEKLFSSGQYVIYGLYHIVRKTGTSGTTTFLERRGAMSG